MKLIPVMDLMAGQVVHARRGERDHYQPMQSTLCPGAAPEAILQALIERFRCAIVYIADLDAIRFRRPQLALLEQLKSRFPDVRFWLDAGISNDEDFHDLQKRDLGTLVIGSENLADTAWLALISKQSWILSLDFKHGHFLGPATLLENPSHWPHRVLAMNLAHVGGDCGPDYPLLDQLRQRQPHCALFAAGGVRDQEDLIALEKRGIAGALVATALHNGKIGATSAGFGN